MTKRYIDVFNGDADGVCSLVQLRLANSQKSELITGVKRDINLLNRVQAEAGSYITVLDISFEKNAVEVKRLLKQGSFIEYIDHHRAGELVKHKNLEYHLDLSASTCTSIIVDKKLHGQFCEWAIVGAFGDNLSVVARQLAKKSNINEPDLGVLQQLGLYLNYNAYGETIDDLFFDPAELFRKMVEFDSPLEFLAQDKVTFITLASGYQEDIQKAKVAPIIYQGKNIAIIGLPNEKWSRRVSGVYSNTLANSFPERAHAVLTEKDNGHYLVSVRAPLNRKYGADRLASQFPSGGGRKAAAGINDLPRDMLEKFIGLMEQEFSCPP